MRLVIGMGMNQVRLAILVELASAGGTLRTADLSSRLGIQVSTVLNNLYALEEAGHVLASDSAHDRRGRRVTWSIQRAPVDDLLDLVKAITPLPHNSSSRSA